MNIYIGTQQDAENARKAQQEQLDKAYAKNHPAKPSSPEFDWEDRKAYGVNVVCSRFSKTGNINAVKSELSRLIRSADPSNSVAFYDSVKQTFDEHTDEFPALAKFLKGRKKGLKGVIDILRHVIIGLSISEQ